MDLRTKETVDLTAPQEVQIVVRDDAKVVWVNADGVCMFRACQIKKVTIEDQRHKLMAEALQAGYDLVQSADAHVTHGGPTKADAQTWLIKTKKVLDAYHYKK